MNELFWRSAKEVLSSHTYLPAETGQYPKRAAVLALLTRSVSPELIFTRRSMHLSHHAGEVCFPGGMWEPHDSSLLASALRETHEEIGVPVHLVDVLGSLPARYTRAGTLVQPFVGSVPGDCRFTLNHHELDVLFKVPLAAFKQGLQVRTDTFERNGQRFHMPAYQYEQYEIWGFTASVTADLLALLLPLA